ncbi:MAG: hypothetical protein KY468_11950 [Armatimonadetes bacterium]|nr:hypothetical protein [Armatimonadota bacterium]
MTPTDDLMDRERFLQELRTLSGGNPDRPVSLEHVAQTLEIDPAQAELIAESLHTGLPGSSAHGLLRPAGEKDFSEVCITPEGLRFLDDVEASGVTT